MSYSEFWQKNSYLLSYREKFNDIWQEKFDKFITKLFATFFITLMTSMWLAHLLDFESYGALVFNFGFSILICSYLVARGKKSLIQHNKENSQIYADFKKELLQETNLKTILSFMASYLKEHDNGKLAELSQFIEKIEANTLTEQDLDSFIQLNNQILNHENITHTNKITMFFDKMKIHNEDFIIGKKLKYMERL